MTAVGVVAVGVTGHRILAETEKLAAGIDEALERIARAFPGRRLAVVSALAEGADRLVADRVLARHQGRLIVALPLATSDYQRDFKTDTSKAEFQSLLARADEIVELPPASLREQAYEAVGSYVLDHCDALIAVWDGQTSQGRGGTGEVVALARQRQLPLAWVHAGNRKPGTEEATSLGPEQGTVTFERMTSDA